MSKMKTEFKLDCHKAELSGSIISIVGTEPDNKPYVHIALPGNMGCLFIEDKDLETLAVNILKALKSKKLKK